MNDLPAWPYPRLAAHRGAGKLAPENTLAAFRLGHAHGYRMAELDAKLSADGVAFLLHDATLDRTTSGRGRADALAWRELAQLDAGAWHSAQYAGEPLPTLATIARWSRAHGVALNVEIKPTPGRERETGAAVALDCKSLWAGADVLPLLSSFAEASLVAAREVAPEIPRAYLTDQLPDDWRERVQRAGCVAADVKHTLLSRERVAEFHAAGLRVCAWTVNDPARAADLLAWGVDTVITDAVDVIPVSEGLPPGGGGLNPTPGVELGAPGGGFTHPPPRRSHLRHRRTIRLLHGRYRYNARCGDAVARANNDCATGGTPIPRALHRDITVIGASAGGIAVLRELLAALPADYPAAIFLVVHLAPDSPPILHKLLDRAGELPVSMAMSGARIRPGTVTIAPPDLHLVLEQDRMRVIHGPRENRHRPSIDVLFRSAAVAFGARVTGVVLSGMLDDGSAGLWAVKSRGGAAVVQDPHEAEFPDMPRNAMETAAVDAIVPARELAPTLLRLAREAVRSAGERAAPPSMASEVRMAQNESSMEELDAIAERVPFTCPECGGSLWQLDNGGPRYRCHNGHAYSLNTLVSEQAIQVEAALWAGLRRLEESERLARHMEQAARSRGNDRSADYHAEMARSSALHAQTLRNLLREKTTAVVSQAANETTTQADAANE